MHKTSDPTWRHGHCVSGERWARVRYDPYGVGRFETCSGRHVWSCDRLVIASEPPTIQALRSDCSLLTGYVPEVSAG